MSVTHVIGVDPGLVHTGVVSMRFLSVSKQILVDSTAIAGLDEHAVRAEVTRLIELEGERTGYGVRSSPKPRIFIEGYKPRSNLAPDRRMQDGVTRIKQAIQGTVLDNMGVKKVVKKDLMNLIGVWNFSTTTHHQDLRSAARIALLGMLKDDRMNLLLADVVSDHLEGATWNVVS